MIERLPSTAFAPRPQTFVDGGELLPLYDKIAFRGNLALTGPKGIGKSLSVAAWAHKAEVPIVTFDCSEDVRRSHLLGGFILRGTETPFVLGPVTTAFEVANECGKCILLLEECNALSPGMQKVLNPVLDFRARVEVPEAQRVFGLEKGAQLWVVGTMNHTLYGGVNALNEDLKSRLRMLTLSYPKSEHERAILQALCPMAPESLVGRVLTLALETRQEGLDYALSTRDVVQLVHDATLVGDTMALRLILGKFEGEDIAVFTKRAHSIFGVRL